MSTSSTAVVRTGPVHLAGRTAWSVLLLATTAYTFWFFKRSVHYWTDSSPASLGRYVNNVFWIRLHVLGGTMALFAGPWQFWTGLRRQSTLGHRRVGYIYLAGIVLLGVGAVNLAVTLPASPDYRAALLGLWIASWTTTGMAYLSIVRRAIGQHQEWMIRSYAVTLAFTLNRVFYEIPALARADIARDIPTDWDAMLVWLAFVPTLLLAEVVIQGRKILKTRRAA